MHAVELAERGDAGEKPRQLGVLLDVGLAEQHAALRVQAGGDQQRRDVVDALAQLGRVVVDRDRVQVDDAVDRRVAAVLTLDVLRDGPDVVAEVLAPGRLDAREDPHERAKIAAPPRGRRRSGATGAALRGAGDQREQRRLEDLRQDATAWPGRRCLRVEDAGDPAERAAYAPERGAFGPARRGRPGHLDLRHPARRRRADRAGRVERLPARASVASPSPRSASAPRPWSTEPATSSAPEASSERGGGTGPLRSVT